MSTEKKCGDCGEGLAQIRLIDRGHFSEHHEAEYALVESKRGLWSGQFPVEGKVVAFMCPQCGKITHYGQPKAKR